MKPFAATLRNGQQFLGLGLSEDDILRLKTGVPAVADLSSVGVGLWFQDQEGKRHFLQPRDSTILVMAGDSAEDIGELLRVDLSQLKKT